MRLAFFFLFCLTYNIDWCSFLGFTAYTFVPFFLYISTTTIFCFILLLTFLLLSNRSGSGSGLLLVSKYYAMHNMYDFVTIYVYSFFAKVFLIFLYFFRGIKYIILKAYTDRTSITFYFWSPTFKKTSYYSLFRSTRTKFL